MPHPKIRRGPVSVLRSFLSGEAAGGLVLIAAAAAALGVANSPAATVYEAALAFHVGSLSVLHAINEGLMALFFLLVGLEVKREWTGGHLATWADRRLPILAALCGMICPAALFYAVVHGQSDLARGWAIPAATDIAFAMAVLALLGSRVPPTLKLFLLTVAIVDDIGAVLVIALAYTTSLDLPALAAAAVLFALMLGLNRWGVRRLLPYVVLAIGLWGAVFLSGIHATVAGVLAALTIPGRDHGRDTTPAPDPLHRLERALHPVVAFLIVPLFGFANAGVSLRGVGWATMLSPLPLAIALGLFVGKQAGIFASVRLTVATGLAARIPGATWTQLYGVALLCGVGFTMSLFIGGLAFADPARAADVKLGVLGGSLLSAIAGFLVLRFAAPEPHAAPARLRPVAAE